MDLTRNNRTSEDYFRRFSGTEVFINRNTTSVLAVDQRNTYFKILSNPIRVILYSISMINTSLIIAAEYELLTKMLTKAKKKGSLQLAFIKDGKVIFYHINCKVSSLSENPLNPGTCIVKVDFAGRLPEDIIEKLGVLLEAKSNFFQRKEERIEISDDDILRELKYSSKMGIIKINNISSNCILKNISFLGAQIIVKEFKTNLLKSEVSLYIKTTDYEGLALKGIVVRAEPILYSANLVSLGISLIEEEVPDKHKILISNYLKKKK